jgi:hypothetical protein
MNLDLNSKKVNINILFFGRYQLFVQVCSEPLKFMNKFIIDEAK